MQEHKGKNNVVATHLCLNANTGLAAGTICGRAVATVDGASLTHRELTRLLYFVNDIVQSDCFESEERARRMREAAPLLFPKYGYFDEGWCGTYNGGRSIVDNEGIESCCSG